MAKHTIETFIDPDKAVADVNTNNNDLSEEFSRQAGLVYYYTGQAAKAEKQLSSMKLRRDNTEAIVETRIREEAATSGEKVTEGLIKSRLAQDKDVLSAKVAVIRADEVLNSIKGICEALRHKKDMLMMTGHMTRDEIKARIAVESELSPRVGQSRTSLAR